MATIKLRKLRIEKKLTIKALADELGIKESTLSKYERAEREPNIETLTLLADYFNVSIDYLVGKSNCIHEEYQPISDLLGIDEKTIKTLQELSAPVSDYSSLDLLEAIIQHPQFPNLMEKINQHFAHDNEDWTDLVVYKDGKPVATIEHQIVKSSSMQVILKTFEGIINALPYSKHLIENKYTKTRLPK